MDVPHLIFQISWPTSCGQAAQSPAGGVARSMIFHRNPVGAQMRKCLAHLSSTPQQPGFHADFRDAKVLAVSEMLHSCKSRRIEICCWGGQLDPGYSELGAEDGLESP
jgi:hypothetical protein